MSRVMTGLLAGFLIVGFADTLGARTSFEVTESGSYVTVVSIHGSATSNETMEAWADGTSIYANTKYHCVQNPGAMSAGCGSNFEKACEDSEDYEVTIHVEGKNGSNEVSKKSKEGTRSCAIIPE